MIHLLEIYPERNRKLGNKSNTDCPNPHINKIWLGIDLAKIRIADASLPPFHRSLATAAAARHGAAHCSQYRMSALNHNWRQAANNQQEIAEI